jgi:hypothetical protein
LKPSFFLQNREACNINIMAVRPWFRCNGAASLLPCGFRNGATDMLHFRDPRLSDLRLPLRLRPGNAIR